MEKMYPIEDRDLTILERKRLQSFPDDFEVCGDTVTSKRGQIGNAVPAKLATALGRQLMKNHTLTKHPIDASSDEE